MSHWTAFPHCDWWEGTTPGRSDSTHSLSTKSSPLSCRTCLKLLEQMLPPFFSLKSKHELRRQYCPTFRHSLPDRFFLLIPVSERTSCTKEKKLTNQQLQSKPAELKCDPRGAFLDYCTEKGEEISTTPKITSNLNRLPSHSLQPGP